MRHTPHPPDEPDHQHGGPARTSADALSDVASAYHRTMRTALQTLRDAHASGDVPGVTGLTPGVVLELDHRLPVPVVRQLEAITSCWHRLPDTTSVYEHGLIEVADLAVVVRACRELSPPAVAELDAWAATRAAHLHATGLLHLLEADVLDRAAQLRAPGWASRQHRREQSRTDRATIQQDFDGGGLLVADLTPTGLAAVAPAVEAVAGPPSSDMARAEQRGAALVAICEHALAGVPTGTPMLDHALEADTEVAHDSDVAGSSCAARPVPGEVRLPTRPRPRITLVVDLAQATSDRFAQLLRVTGLQAAPTLTARLTETLAADAELLVQLVDGKRPLAELRAIDIPDAVRRAVVVRDRGCRAPGCHRPPSQCDLHHVVPRRDPRLSDADRHDPDNLLLLCRHHHRMLDDRPWHLRLDPISATVTWRYGTTATRVRRTVPHGTRPPPRHPDDVPLAPWQAPPVPPPPPDPPPEVDGSQEPLHRD